MYRVMCCCFTLGLLQAQSGQSRRNPNWPCGATIDSSYLRTSEATGGYVLLFQPGEAEKSGAFLSAQFSHKQTVFRASGLTLSGTQEFSFPVESGIASIFLVGQSQCMERVQFFRPNSAELGNDSSTRITEYKAGRMIQLASPEPGIWHIRIAGRGVFAAFALAQSELTAGVTVKEDGIAVHAAEGFRDPKLTLITADDKPIASIDAGSAFIKPQVPYRIKITGTDPNGYAVQRIHPNLFGIQ